jgi:hypothetical protein
MGKDRQGCTRIQCRISVTESPSERHSVHTELRLLRSRIGVRDEKASLCLRAMAGSSTFPGSVTDGLCSLRPYHLQPTSIGVVPCLPPDRRVSCFSLVEAFQSIVNDGW